jgi:hypothetical protein
VKILFLIVLIVAAHAADAAGVARALLRSNFRPPSGATTNATDTFDRADGGLGANWTTQTGTAIAIVSNQAKTTTASTDQFAFWNANTFDANQRSLVTVTTENLGTVIVSVRCSGTGGSMNAYWARKDGIHKFVAGAYTQLLADDAASLVQNGILEIRVVGTTIKRYVDGVEDGSVTDASLASGSPGLGFYLNSGVESTANNWEGGNTP